MLEIYMQYFTQLKKYLWQTEYDFHFIDEGAIDQRY